MLRVRALFWDILGQIVLYAAAVLYILEKVFQVRRILRRIGGAEARTWTRLGRDKYWPILISILMVFARWLRSYVNQATLWNLPPFSASPFPHLSLYAAPLLDILSYSWIGSLGFSIIYSSRKHLGRFSWIGKLSGRFMKVTLLFYPALVLWFSSYAELSFLVPSSGQGVLYFAAAVPLTFLVFRSIESVINRKVLGKQGILSAAIDKALAFASIGTRCIGEWGYGNYRYVYSRITGHPLEVEPHPKVRPTILALLLSLSLVSMTAAYKLGFTSVLELFYAFGVAPYALAIAAGVVGWRILKEEDDKRMWHFKEMLDLFQRGTYPQTLSIDNVVHIANTRVGAEVYQPFAPWTYDEVVHALSRLKKQGYHIRVDKTNREITFTRYPL